MHLTIRHYLAIALVTFAIFLPGRMTLPPLDRDEPRYMEATAQMLSSGNYVDVRFLDQPRYLQPAGIYWLEALSVKAFGGGSERQPWPYRIPSLVAVTLAVMLTAWLGALLFGGQAGVMAAALLATSTLLTAEGRMATIDSVLLLDILLVETALLLAYRGARDGRDVPLWTALLYWGALGCGLMLKGPVVLIPGFLTPLVLWAWERDRSWWRGLRPAWGWVLMLVIVLPWCVAIDVVSHGDFFARAVGVNFLGKIGHGQEAHGSAPGFHLAVFGLAFWPGSLFAVLAVPAVWMRRRLPEVRFLLCWIVPHWIVFELIATKLPHYVMPTYPAIALLTGAALTVWPQREAVARWVRGVMWAYAGVWFVLGLVFAGVGMGALWGIERIWSPRELIAVLGAVPLVVVSGWLLLKRDRQRAAWSAIAAAVVIHTGLFVAVIPRLQTIWLAPRIATMFDDLKPCRDSTLVSTAFSEPSLVFLVGQNTRLLGAQAAAGYLADHQDCSLALVNRKDDAVFESALQARGLKSIEYGRIAGVNYSNGHHLDLGLFAPIRP